MSHSPPLIAKATTSTTTRANEEKLTTATLNLNCLATSTTEIAKQQQHYEYSAITSRKRPRKRLNPQALFSDTRTTVAVTEDTDTDDGSPMPSSDVKTFQGKIVYNHDGNAYIIDAENAQLSNLTDTSLNFGIANYANGPTAILSSNSAIPATAAPKSIRSAANPKIHSFRVVSASVASISHNKPNAKIHKPILMCFICKLSFGNTKSFSLHANSDHTLNLKELEENLLNREFSSAIIQRNMDEKPQISFLEPLDVELMRNENIESEVNAATAAEAEIATVMTKSSSPTSQSLTKATTQATKNDNVVDTCRNLTPPKFESTETLIADYSSNSKSSNNCDVPISTSSNSPSKQATDSDVGISRKTYLGEQQEHQQSPYEIIDRSAVATTTNTLLSFNLGSLNTATSKTNISKPVENTFLSMSSPVPLLSSSSTSTTITTNTPPLAPSSSTPNLDNIKVAVSITKTTTTATITTKRELATTSFVSSTDNLSNNKIPLSNNSKSKNPNCPLALVSPPNTKIINSGSPSPNLSSPVQKSPPTVGDILQHFQYRQCNTTSPGTTLDNTAIEPASLQQLQQLQSLLPQATTFPVGGPHNHLSSLHASLSSLSNDQNSNSVKLISEFLQHQLAVQQQHQEHFSVQNCCPDHPDIKGNDCKSCEMLEVHQHLKSPVLQQQHSSPTSIHSNAMLPTTFPMSPTTSVGNVGNNVNSSTAGTVASFTIGACSEHINGRPLGIDCARCEMILTSARLNSGVQMSTRNSCKTLKCPQCNWHYKYQETLEIHMREKHPDGESACGYCLAGQQHPRLARGESYSCGYKPYRCEICNYSTTTKGNLSIHMQSDKHLNNMQELNSSQNMVAAAAAAAAVGKLDATATTSKMLLPNSMSMQSGSTTPLQQQKQQQQQQSVVIPTSSSATTGNSATSTVSKPKPSFRCDICSYETSVARNLRIHMTSEKHTHNMAVLQNNIKHIQAFSFLQQQHQQATVAQNAAAAAAAAATSNIGTLPQLPSGIGSSSFLPEVALADLAYNQALMIQLLQQNAAVVNQHHGAKDYTKLPSPTSTAGTISNNPALQQQQHQQQQQKQLSSNTKSPTMLLSDLAGGDLSLSSTTGTTMTGDTLEPPTKPDPCPTTLFSCLVCSAYNTNNLDDLNQHLLVDRSRHSGNSTDIMVILNNNYICRLCNYKTNLKANFQLHSKTDKHLQKLNFINHIREGGPCNEYKLKYQQISTNTVQLKCNCCDFHTNSIQKLSLHTQHMRHDTMRLIFQHLLHLVQQSNEVSNIEQKTQTTTTPTAASNKNHTNNKNNSNIVTATESECLDRQQKQYHQLDCHNKALLCQLCNFTALNLLDMVQHIKSLRHLQVEQFICLQRRSENLETPNLEDVFKLGEYFPGSEDGGKAELVSPHSASTIVHGKAPNLHGTSEDGMSGATTLGVDNNSFSPDSSCSVVSGNNSSSSKYQTPGGLSMGDMVASSTGNVTPNVLSLIYKCNNCDYFGQSKNEMELHLESLHPNADQDFISIPTNAAALQAFQAAVAAATLAAVTRCSEKSPHGLEDDCPIAIKKERLELCGEDNDDEEEEQICTGISADLSGAETMKVDYTQQEHQREEQQIEADTSSKNSFTQQLLRIKVPSVQCPLCQDNFTEKHILELHLMRMHSVSRDGLARLLQLVDNSIWHNMSITTMTSHNSTANVSPTSSENTLNTETNSELRTLVSRTAPDVNYELCCQQCGSSFKHEQQLLQHAQNSQHYSMQNSEYICLAANRNRPCHMLFATLSSMLMHYKDTHMSLVISERHVYKYRCKQCSLAFKTQEKLTTHTLYHTMRDATKCSLCQRNFRSTQALQKHMEHTHEAYTSTSSATSELKISRPSSPNVVCAGEEERQESADRILDASTAKNSTVHNSPSAASPQHIEQQNLKMTTSPTKNVNTPHMPPLSPISCATQQQQQHVAAITAALLKQQHLQQHQQYSDVAERCSTSPDNALQQFQYQQNQQQIATHFPSLMPQNLQSMQNLHNLQNLQQLQHQIPQIAAAAAASGIPLSPVDMLNLMQFHHLMSFNFMNLAPPLIFGGNTSSVGNTPTASIGAVAASVGASEISHSVVSPTASGVTPVPTIDVNPQLMQQQQQQTSPNSASQLTNNQKRARTRITDDQLKILRAHFDINNSPSEESIMDMSQKANLPMKVVKHWFRNTLFKERQRNKDSPYNFNNPPSTTLNLEEYERTGQTKVTSLNEAQLASSNTVASGGATGLPQHVMAATTVAGTSMTQSRPASAHSSSACDFPPSQLNYAQQEDLKQRQIPECGRSHASSVASDVCTGDVQIKSEPSDDSVLHADCEKELLEKQQQQPKELLTSNSAITFLKHHQQRLNALADQQEAELREQSAQQVTTAVNTALQKHHHHQQQQQSQQSLYYNSYETKSESGSSDILSRPQTPNSTSASNAYSNMSELLNQQLDNLPIGSMTNIGNMNNMGPPKKFQISKVFEKNSPSSSQFDTNSNSSNASSTSSGKRANRTRFTDYQIKVLQEFFENNSYPKDSDLEYLSKLLLLSPRVIVVWFQNARQKQRKIYENQPNNSLYESEEKKQNINYACKKCNLVFQRYYELIRHQKNHCFKEENNKKSAKAQIAAAQIAQNLSSEDSNSSMDINNAATLLTGHKQTATVAAVVALGSGGPISSISPGSGGLNLITTSPQHLLSKSSSSLADFSPSTTPTPPQRERSNSIEQQPKQKFDCDKCKLSFNHYDHFREHQLMHMMNPNLFTQHPDTSTYGSFGSILQSLQQAAVSQQQQQLSGTSSNPHAKKRKYSETSSNADDMSSLGGVSVSGDYTDAQNKRYDFLYQYFIQNENNIDLKQQFQSQQQQSQEPELEMDFLANFYQQTELKKRSNYDFLLQYYIKNEQQLQKSYNSDNKPSIDFLLQYYQINESKKFFQLDASPQHINDCILIHETQEQQQQHNELNHISLQATPPMPTDELLSNKDTNNGNNKSSSNLTAENVQMLNESDMHKNANVYMQENVAGAIPICGGVHKQFIKNNNNNKQIRHFRDEDEEDYNTGQQEQQQTCNKSSILPVLQSVESKAVVPLSTNIATMYKNAKSPTQSNTYYHNLEDFLDASMIENHTQTLRFNDATDDSLQSMLIPATIVNSNINSTAAGAGDGPSTKPASFTEHKQNKRLRTTILPEQLNFLYECYQNESNPSRKMLEEISRKVNLKKRVVQVWYQNSRARERKGQFRQNMQIINKKCPYCSSIFKVKSALEWHMQSKHAKKPKIKVEMINDIETITTLATMSAGCPMDLTNKHDDHKGEQDEIENKCENENKRCERDIPCRKPMTTGVDGPNTNVVATAITAIAPTASTDQQEQIFKEMFLTDVTQLRNDNTLFMLHIQQQNQHHRQQQQELHFVTNNIDATVPHILKQQYGSVSPTCGSESNSFGVQNGEKSTTALIYQQSLSSVCSNASTTSLSSTSISPTQIAKPTSIATTPAGTNLMKKRLRTQMSNMQIRILKYIFKDSKTPTVNDCFSISREIGLQKRFIQVWFQNSRAKDKKSRNQRYVNIADESNNAAKSPRNSSCSNHQSAANEFRDCKLCHMPQVNKRKHAFSVEHIRKVKALLEHSHGIPKGLHDDNDEHDEYSERDYGDDNYDYDEEDDVGIAIKCQNGLHEKHSNKLQNMFNVSDYDNGHEVDRSTTANGVRDDGSSYENNSGDDSACNNNNAVARIMHVSLDDNATDSESRQDTTCNQQNGTAKTNVTKYFSNIQKEHEKNVMVNFNTQKQASGDIVVKKNENDEEDEDEEEIEDEEEKHATKMHPTDIMPQLFNFNQITVIGGK